EETGLLALQGPASADVLAEIGGESFGALRRFQFARAPLAGCHSVLASRTGYTGADGFELYCSARDAVPLFEALLEAGRAHGLVPAGLGARDTLRLEAALPLYGQELDADTTPVEAGLARFVELDRDFVGAAAVRRRRDAGFTRALVGFAVEDRGIARAGYPVLAAGARVGRVTSGGPSPTLGRAIGLAYVPSELSAVGAALEIEVRGRAICARVVETPFGSGKAAGRPTTSSSHRPPTRGTPPWPTPGSPTSCTTPSRTNGRAPRASASRSASPTTRSSSSATSCSWSCPRWARGSCAVPRSA